MNKKYQKALAICGGWIPRFYIKPEAFKPEPPKGLNMACATFGGGGTKILVTYAVNGGGQ